MPTTRSLLFALAAIVAAPSAAEALTLDGDFDHGSLGSWSGTPAAINLTPRTNFSSNGSWRWMYFEATGLLGATTQFTTTSNFALGAGRLDRHRMRYSYDNENWLLFDNNARVGSTYRFSNNTPFASDTVYVAYDLPYSYGRSAAHTAAVLATPWAEPSFSADAAGVIGQTPGGTDDIGRAIGPRDLFGYRITNPATDAALGANKRRVTITSGMHAGETIGTWTFQGMVDWLVSDDPRAARLRDVAEFAVYPVLNPDGRFAGYGRNTVFTPLDDPNGAWTPSVWINRPDIQVSGEAMIADFQAAPQSTNEAFIDFHSTVPTGGDDFSFIEIEQGDHLVDWYLNLRALQPNLEQIESTSVTPTSANFGEAFLNAEVDITFENQHGLNRPKEYYLELGENFAFGMYEAWVEPTLLDGDYNFDGVVDAADYTVWRDTFLTLGDLKAPADGNRDTFVGNSDYSLWAANFGAAELGGSASATPEPAAAVLLMAGLILRGRRVK
ncbi:MAG: M14 family zinc carboxypeptidase [Planctomycetota bacterium]